MKKILSILFLIFILTNSCNNADPEPVVEKMPIKEDTVRISLIKSLFVLRRELDKIETRDSILQETLTKKKSDIDSLIDKTLDLKGNGISLVLVTKKYEKVKIEKENLSQKVDSIHKEYIKIYGDNYKLMEELNNQKNNNIDLTSENTNLKKKVESASNVVLTGIKITGLGYTLGILSKSKEYETNKASKIKNIKFTCVLPPNDLAKKEDKKITFTMYSVNNSIFITKDTVLHYTGKDEAITFTLKTPSIVEAGNHKVTVTVNKNQYKFFYKIEN